MLNNVSVAGRRVGVAAVGLLIGLTIAVAGCTHKTSAGPAASPTTPAASPSPSVDPGVAKAIAAYNGAFRAYTAAAAVANPDDPNLANYMGGPLLLRTRHDLRVLKDHAAVELGDPKTTVIGTHAALSAVPPTVTVDACVDYTAWRLVYQRNQSPVPNSSLKLARYTTTATVTQFVNGQWLVSADTPHRDTPC